MRLATFGFIVSTTLSTGHWTEVVLIVGSSCCSYYSGGWTSVALSGLSSCAHNRPFDEKLNCPFSTAGLLSGIKPRFDFRRPFYHCTSSSREASCNKSLLYNLVKRFIALESICIKRCEFVCVHEGHLGEELVIQVYLQVGNKIPSGNHLP